MLAAALSIEVCSCSKADRGVDAPNVHKLFSWKAKASSTLAALDILIVRKALLEEKIDGKNANGIKTHHLPIEFVGR